MGDLGSGFDPWVGKIPWKRERLPTPVFWPGESHELYSPRDRKESDTTEGLSLTDTQEGRQEGACLKGFPYLCLCVLAVPHDEDPP